MKILITGADGFVGRNLVRRLGDGHDITQIDLKRGSDALHWFHHNDDRYDLVFHLAALVGGRLNIEGSPATLAARDLELDAAMFRWALQTGTRVAYFSSSAAYPTHLQDVRGVEIRLEEDMLKIGYPFMPDTSYGWTKLTGEYLAHWAQQEGLRANVFRPFSGYGPDQDLDYPFPSFIERARKREPEFLVWGDGTQVRDFIHIDDVVDGAIAALREGVDGPVNLCTGRSTSFDLLAQQCMLIAGYKAPIVHDTTKPMGVLYRVGDPTKLLSFYQPKITLEAGIVMALRA